MPQLGKPVFPNTLAGSVLLLLPSSSASNAGNTPNDFADPCNQSAIAEPGLRIAGLRPGGSAIS
jgi:hypothetical protein